MGKTKGEAGGGAGTGPRGWGLGRVRQRGRWVGLGQGLEQGWGGAGQSWGRAEAAHFHPPVPPSLPSPRYTCPFVEKFSIEIETYYRPDSGKQTNVFNLTAAEKRQRILGKRARGDSSHGALQPHTGWANLCLHAQGTWHRCCSTKTVSNRASPQGRKPVNRAQTYLTSALVVRELSAGASPVGGGWSLESSRSLLLSLGFAGVGRRCRLEPCCPSVL